MEDKKTEKEWDQDIDLVKDSILKDYPRNQKIITKAYGEKSGEAGEKILKLMKSRGLTYEQAYASLQYVYETLKYESNFVKVQ